MSSTLPIYSDRSTLPSISTYHDQKYKPRLYVPNRDESICSNPSVASTSDESGSDGDETLSIQIINGIMSNGEISQHTNQELSSRELKQISISNKVDNKIFDSKCSDHRRLELAPSCFLNGCICGHDIEFRDMVYDTRKRRNTRCQGVTIKPKTQPVSVSLRRAH